MTLDRRDFLGRSTGAIFGASALATGRRSHAVSANEKIVLGAIGLGGRGSGLVRGFAERPDVEFAYLCDLDPRRGNDLVQELTSIQRHSPRKVTEFRRVLDDKGVDAVIVATPDHWHGPASVFACQAGKDVYVEKPASHNVWEGRKMVEAARRYHRVVQVGMQNRSAPYVEKARQYIASGLLGEIHLCKVFNLKSGGAFHKSPDSAPPEGFDFNAWLGPAPERPFNEGLFRGGWHAYWDFSGGDLADDGVHQLDIARWLVGKDYPKAVSCFGGNFAFKDDREVPDTQVATFEFDDLLMTLEATQWPPYMDKIAGDVRNGDLFPDWMQCATRIELYGTKGLMMFGRHGGGWQVFERPRTQSRPGVVVAQEFGRFPDVPHKQNFVESLRDRKTPNADIEEGHRSALMIHIANISERLGGRRLSFNAETESFEGDAEANRLLKRDYRAPFVIPEMV